MELIKKIEMVIEELRPYLQSDGGDVEFSSFDKDTKTVFVRFHGACVGCPISHITLYEGIKNALIDKVPEVKNVERVD